MAQHHPTAAGAEVEHGGAGTQADAHVAHAHHPTAKTYVIIGAILTAITIVEVWIYYTPFQNSKLFVPTLLILSAVKFFTVVAFYMHLKYDHKLFRVLFTGPFIIAGLTMIGLMFLFGHFSIRTGLLK
ncbi:MAG: cytochrome C oxidase subunit IV family protein [Vicinamibacterales bacterium]